MNRQLICPICDGRDLSLSPWSMELEHRGRTTVVDGLEGHLCNSCGADPVFEAEARRNDRKICDARRALDGLLTGDQIKAIRGQLGLSQQQAADLFGGGPMAFSKYERGVTSQSVAMDRLLRIVADFPTLMGRLAEYAGLEEWLTSHIITTRAGASRPPSLPTSGGKVVSMQDYPQRAA